MSLGKSQSRTTKWLHTVKVKSTNSWAILPGFKSKLFYVLIMWSCWNTSLCLWFLIREMQIIIASKLSGLLWEVSECMCTHIQTQWLEYCLVCSNCYMFAIVTNIERVYKSFPPCLLLVHIAEFAIQILYCFVTFSTYSYFN